MSTMTYLAENSFWRSSFKDQLEIAYKDHLYDHVLEDVMMHEISAEFIEIQITDQFINICD